MRRNRTLALVILIVLLVAAGVIWHFRSASPDSDTTGWETTTQNGVTFQYPAELSTTYIHATDWPPQVTLADGPFTCAEKGDEVMPNGRTESLKVGGHTYCRTAESEGAAGSIYITYSYAAPMGNKVATLTFTIREVQCPNYDDPQKTECQTERDAFNIDSLADRIFRTLQ